MIAAGGGSIINLGSNSWWETAGDFPVYATTKAAVHGMTRTLARASRKAPYPREHYRAWLGHDGAAKNDVGDAGGARTASPEAVSARPDCRSTVARMALFLASDDAAKWARRTITWWRSRDCRTSERQWPETPPNQCTYPRLASSPSRPCTAPQLFPAAIGSQALRGIKTILAELPSDQAEIRIHGTAALRPYLSALGPIGAVAASLLEKLCLPGGATLFQRRPERTGRSRGIRIEPSSSRERM